MRPGSRRTAALLCLLAWLLLAGSAIAGQLRGRVTWIYDGDTVKVAGVGKVRLLGIDAPEHENSPRDHFLMRRGVSRPTLRRIAREALHFNIAVAKGRTVRLRTDRDLRDRYGRLLAYVYLPDGRLLNRLLLQKGYAVVYRRFSFRLKADFLRVEARARRRRAGVWAK